MKDEMRERIRFEALMPSDKWQTRPLYEAAFPEDCRAYVDYYYQWKSPQNEIFVLKQQGGSDDDWQICAMMHLNPYTVWVSTRAVRLHYLVAVATEKSCRRKGYMRRLMKEAFRWLYNQMEPFTYLMPANTAYYLPFGFRTVYEQKKVVFPQELEAANQWAKQQFDVVTLRDRWYQQFEEANPDQKKEAAPVADWTPSANESGTDQTPDSQAAPQREGWKPTIMVRIIHLRTFLQCFRADCKSRIYLRITDTLIPENNGWFIWRVDSQESHVDWCGATLHRRGSDMESDLEIADWKRSQEGPFWQEGVRVSCLETTMESLTEQLFCRTEEEPALSSVHLLKRICINEEV